ncbi:MAG: TonB-dependent receptor [Proteobacteria bacterium]|nr:TonB-dependent receptor [Pseudomonadota bacterium]MBU1738576.1 TonB-dependent receptor [Pseudomonadota bacterium]
MRFSEEVQSKLTILKVKEWETFQVVLRSLRRFARKVTTKKAEDVEVSEKIVLVAFLAAMILSFSGNSSAGETGAEAVAVMDEVVVTATKTEEKRKDIASSVVVKDAVDIEEAPAESLGGLLANEPGIDWRTYGNYGGASQEIQIRGMDGKGTMLVMDGVVLNSPSLGVADVSQIPLNTIERVEVVKGPGSLLYGSGAMGGTVNIISKKPKRDQPVTKVEAGYGTESAYHLAAETGRFATEDFGYYLTVNRKETDGFRENSDLEHNDIGLNLLFDKGDSFGVDFNFGYVDREYGMPGVEPPAGITPYYLANGQLLYNGESASLLDRHEEENRHSSIVMKGTASDSLDWRVKGDCAVLRSSNYERYSSGGSESTITNTIRGMEGNLDLHPFSQVGMVLGSEYRNFDYENEQTSLDADGNPTGSGIVDEEHRIFTQGSFAELNLRPIKQVRLFVGYRYETNSKFGHEDVSRYGLVVNPLPMTAVKVSHGQHFKAPTMNDLFWPDQWGMRGNPDLKPETGWYSDITVEQSLLAGKFFASLSHFKWDVADKISWYYDPATFYYSPANLDSYKASGWEAGTKIGPYRSLLVDLSLTLLDAEEELSPGAIRAARYTPETQFKAGLTHYADFGLTSSVVARYTGARPGYYAGKTNLEAQIELESYWTVDLKMQQELKDHWRVSLLATNLLDEEYDTYISTFYYPDFTSAQQPYPGAGRTVFASVAYEF